MGNLSIPSSTYGLYTKVTSPIFRIHSPSTKDAGKPQPNHSVKKKLQNDSTLPNAQSQNPHPPLLRRNSSLNPISTSWMCSPSNSSAAHPINTNASMSRTSSAENFSSDPSAGASPFSCSGQESKCFLVSKLRVLSEELCSHSA